MQNTTMLLFVRSLSLTNLRNAQLRYGLISDRSLLTLQLTSAESISRHASVQMVDILSIFCEQRLANSLHFSCVFGSSGFYLLCHLFILLMCDRR